MAKVKFGAIVTDLRNKVGGHVYSKNRYGAYTRSYKTTLTSNTPAQIVAKSRLSSISATWKTLTDDQRTAWNNAVSNFRHTDVFGSIINPSGFDLYIRLNCNLDQVGVALLSLPPVPAEILTLTNVSITADGTAPLVALVFGSSPVPAGYAIVLSATNNISPGISYVKNLVRGIAVLDAGTTSIYDATTAYLAKYSSITNGYRLSVSLVTVNKSTGQKSPPYFATCIIGTGIGLDFNQALDTGIPLG